MTEGVEAIGEAVSGGMVARAVEPHAGEHDGQAANCLNCGAALIGGYCHQCGQQAHVHRTLGAFWHDLAHGVLHFEGKIWRTLPLLLWHPGKLTRRYIEGERSRFVSPMALFLFAVFMMFAVFSAIGGPFETGMDSNEFRNTKADLAAALESSRDDLKELGEDLTEAIREGDSEKVASLKERVGQTRQAVATLEEVQDTPGVSTLDVNWNSGWERLDKGVEKLAENPSLALYKVQNNAYKFSWLLIPLSVPFVWLLFPFRRGVSLYDHTVFVTYSLAFVTLLMVTLSFLRVAGLSGGWISSAFAFVPLVHMYRQLRGAYRLRWWSAALRTLLLFVFANIVISLFVMLLIVIGALG